MREDYIQEKGGKVWPPKSHIAEETLQETGTAHVRSFVRPSRERQIGLLFGDLQRR